MADRYPSTISWTADQQKAIYAGRENLLISAAAGSGKTATLTERIFRLLTDEVDPIPLSDIVAITFTRAAAAQLKEKLSRRIAEAEAQDPTDRRLHRLQMQLPQANISTVHSFCLKIVRENAAALGLPPRLTLGEESFLSKMRILAMEETLDAFYAPTIPLSAEAQEVRALLFKLFRSDRDGHTATLLKLYDKLRSLEEGVGKLGDLISEGEATVAAMREGRLKFLQTSQGRLMKKQLFLSTESMLEKLSAYFAAFPADERNDPKILPAALCLADEIRLLQTKCRTMGHDYDAMVRALGAVSVPSYKNTSKSIPTSSDQGKSLKSLYEKVKKELLTLQSEHLLETDALLEEEQRRLTLERSFFDILRRFEARYSEKKLSLGLLDYSDLEHYGLKALRVSGTTYCRALFVDEYQDTNRLQDIFFRRCVEKGGFFFFVGDVKQSIYRFRNAAPDLFLSYKNDFLPYGEPLREGEAPLGRCILFSENFRSDENVIAFANTVFDVLLNDQHAKKKRLYSALDHLRFSKKKNRDLPVEYYLIDRNDTDGKRRDEYTFVADRVRKLIEEEGRAPEEIAVIAYSNRALATLRAVLKKSGISTASGDTELFECPEVKCLVALLSAIADPFDNIALAALLTSPIFAFSSQELVTLRSYSGGALFSCLMRAAHPANLSPIAARCTEVTDFLETWQAFSNSHSSADTTLHLLRAGGIIASLTDGDAQKRENLFKVYEFAREAESMGPQTLSSLIRHLKARESEENPTASDAEVRRGFVTLMTVHKSKGLEFPVCIFMGLGRTNPAEARTLFDPGYGLFLPEYREDAGAFFTPVSMCAVKRLIRQENSEEQKRLLYVGITRAAEKLILVDAPRQSAAARFADAGLYPFLERGAIHSHELNSPALMLLYSLRYDEALKRFAAKYMPNGKVQSVSTETCTFTVVPSSEVPTILPAEKQGTKKKCAEHFTETDLAVLARRLNTEKERRRTVLAPSKLSVSELIHLDEKPTQGDTHLSFARDERRGSRIGSAMHAFMQFCDFEAAEANCEAEAARLCDLAFLSEEEVKLLNVYALQKFFRSPLFSEIKQSPHVKRELRFNVFLHAQDVLRDLREGDVLIQGVIDCFYEKEDGTYAILDFKTDAVKPENGEEVLLSRHAKQLQLYKKALEEMTGKTVSSLALYSFALARKITVPAP